MGRGLEGAAARRHAHPVAVGDAEGGGVGIVQLDERAAGQRAQALGAPGHRACVVLGEHAARHHGQRVFLVGKLRRGTVVRRGERTHPLRELVPVQDGRAGMPRVRARPLKAPPGHLVAVEAHMAHAAVRRRDRGYLVHDLRSGQTRLPVAHAVHDLREHVGVQPRPRRPLHGLAHALHAALGVRERALLLRVAAAGQHEVGQLRRLGEEQVLHHEEVERRERPQHVPRVRVGAHRVLAEQEQPAHAPLQHGGEAFGGLEPPLAR